MVVQWASGNGSCNGSGNGRSCSGNGSSGGSCSSDSRRRK